MDQICMDQCTDVSKPRFCKSYVRIIADSYMPNPHNGLQLQSLLELILENVDKKYFKTVRKRGY